MKKVIFALIGIFTILSIFTACQDDDFQITPRKSALNLPEQAFDYVSTAIVPNHFGDELDDNTPNFNQVTDHGATLGRVLFYDTKLSLNNSVACASCHFQENAFSDVVAKSTGFDNRKTSRNSLPIFNNKYTMSFFWDMEVHNLEDQVVMPIKDHIEMGIENLSDLEVKLRTIDYYPELFENAFGSPEITSTKISKSMSQFIRSIVSQDAKFDEGVNSNFSNFSDLEIEGMDVFERADCNSCHSSANFGGTIAANIGLDLDYQDKGIGLLTSVESNGVFKVPSLRNIELTGPYMHDGRFETLEEVIEHYSMKIVEHQNLDFRLRNGGGNSWDSEPGGGTGPFMSPLHFEFTQHEKDALLAFLKTLTDKTLINDEKYSSPFK